MWRTLVAWLQNWQRDEKGRRRPGSWQQAFTGQAYYALDPCEEEIHFDDICIGLSREGRYVNQTREPYSVGEHSVIVSLTCERLAKERGWDPADALIVAREGLMHDAAEAYISDVARPIKRQRVMKGYCKLEAKWEAVIYKKFGITPTKESTALVKEVDTRIVLDEVEALMYDPDMWQRTNRYPGVEPLGVEIAALPWDQAAAVFAQRYLELWPPTDEVVEAVVV